MKISLTFACKILFFAIILFNIWLAYTQTSNFTPNDARADPENWREVNPENLLIFTTTKGKILIEILPDIAPKHAKQFRSIARSDLYNGTEFHRVIRGFMAQGGDIERVRKGGSGLPNIQAEFTFRRNPEQMPLDLLGQDQSATEGYYMGFPIKTQSKFLAFMTTDGRVESWMLHCKGIVSTARTSDNENSGNSQFFLMRATAPHLDKLYTAWGRVVHGQDVVDDLELGEPPKIPDILTDATIGTDVPDHRRPTVWVMRTDGPKFKSYLASLKEAEVCKLPPVKAIVED